MNGALCFVNSVSHIDVDDGCWRQNVWDKIFVLVVFLESHRLILKKSYNNNSFCQVQIDLGNELILFKTLLTCCDNLTENHIIGNNSN